MGLNIVIGSTPAGVGTIADGNYGAFTVSGGVAEIVADTITADNIPDGEIPPSKLVGYSAITGADGNILTKSGGVWAAADPEPVFYGLIPGAVSNGTYKVILKIRRACTLIRLVSKLESGSCTLAVTIDGVNVTSLSGINQTTAELSTDATGANTCAEGVTVAVVVSAGSSPTDLSFQIEFVYG